MGATNRAHEVDDGHDHQARRDDLRALRYLTAAHGSDDSGAGRDDDEENVPQHSEKTRRHSLAGSKIRQPLSHPAVAAANGRSNYLARDNGVFIEPVHRAETMIAVGDDHPSGGFLSIEQQWRNFQGAENVCPDFLHMVVVGVE